LIYFPTKIHFFFAENASLLDQIFDVL